MLTVKVSVDLRPLERYVNILATPGQKGFDEVLIRWIVRYKKSMLARYRRNSRGGGDWAPLKEPIRKRVRKKSRLILRDSDTLINALTPVRSLSPNPAPGAYTKRTSKGVHLGFGRGSRHPYAKHTIGKLAEIHHYGGPKLPARTLLIAPNSKMLRSMQQDVRDVANEIKRRLGLK